LTGRSAQLVIFENTYGATDAVHGFSAATPFLLPACGKLDFHTYHTAPLVGGAWRLLGETAKWMPVSAARVQAIDHSGTNTLTVEIRGVPAEVVTLQLLAEASGRIHTQTCTLPESGRVAVVADITAGTSCQTLE